MFTKTENLTYLFIQLRKKNANYLLAINIQLKLDTSKYNVKFFFLNFFIIKKRNFVKILYVISCYNSYNYIFYQKLKNYIYLKKIKFQIPNYNTLAYYNILY